MKILLFILCSILSLFLFSNTREHAEKIDQLQRELLEKDPRQDLVECLNAVFNLARESSASGSVVSVSSRFVLWRLAWRLANLQGSHMLMNEARSMLEGAENVQVQNELSLNRSAVEFIGRVNRYLDERAIEQAPRRRLRAQEDLGNISRLARENMTMPTLRREGAFWISHGASY